jgi:AraC-like DNA-binding protein
LIRSVSLQTYEEAAKAVGVDPFRQMTRAGLFVGQPIPGDAFVPYSLFGQLLETTAELAGCPDFGLRMARWPDSFYEGPLILLMRHAATLREALALIRQHGHVYSHAFRPAIEPVPDDSRWVDVVVGAKDGESTRFVQATEYTLLTLLRALRYALGRAADDWTIMLPHPMAASEPAYALHFEGRCRFDMPIAALRIPASDLDLELPARNPLRLKMAVSYIEGHFRRADERVSEQVRRMLRQRLGTRQVMQGDIAADLSIHEKTLQRRLAKEGCAFPALLDEVRRDHFLELLRRPTRPGLAQIALMLGYSEQAALSRSCQRWFGCSPSEVLRRHQAADTAPAMARRRQVAAQAA